MEKACGYWAHCALHCDLPCATTSGAPTIGLPGRIHWLKKHRT